MPLPKVLVIHTGGTLGMDADLSYEVDKEGHQHLKHGTGGTYTKAALKPGGPPAYPPACRVPVPEVTSAH
jgi:hypothetical protein